jgi:hypothetical protein
MRAGPRGVRRVSLVKRRVGKVQEKTSRRGDVVMGGFWILFGIAIVLHSMQMPIPRHLGATALTGPGLVPALLGGALVLLGAILMIRALRGVTILSSEEDVPDPRQLSILHPLVALVLMLVYSIALALRQPFIPWTIGFVALFVIVFNWNDASTIQKRAKLVAGALVLALSTAFIVQFVFEDLFYVRLP